jgi:hypothetical protein
MLYCVLFILYSNWWCKIKQFGLSHLSVFKDCGNSMLSNKYPGTTIPSHMTTHDKILQTKKALNNSNKNCSTDTVQIREGNATAHQSKSSIRWQQNEMPKV